MAGIIAGIGVSGSGKTTFLTAFAAEHGFAYISPDDLRKEISGDTTIQKDMQQVWDAAYEKLRDCIARGETVVFDATLYKQKDRHRFTTIARAAGADRITGIYFNVPLAVALERNAGRDRQVPEYAVARMHRFLNEQPPSLEDGFDKIFTPEELAKRGY